MQKDAPSLEGKQGRPISDHEWVALVAVCVLATLPIWIARYPPMTDLPQHAAQVTMLHDLQRPDSAFHDFYQVNWFTPYLLGYVLLYALLPFVSAVVGTKVVLALALISFPLATAAVMREAGADVRWVYLTIPGLYGFAYAWGFVNYIVAAPLGMLMLYFGMRHTRKPTLATSAMLALFSILLFFSHGLICLLFVFLTAGYIDMECKSTSGTLKRMAPLAIVVPLFLFWGRGKVTGPTQASFRSVGWFLGWFQPHSYLLGRITGFMPRLLGAPPSVACQLFGLLLFALPCFAGASMSRKQSVWLPFMACMFILLFFPAYVFGVAFVYPRFATFALPFFVMALGRAATPVTPRYRFCALLAPVLALLAIAWTSLGTWDFRREADGFRTILATMEPGQRVLALIFEPDSSHSTAPPFPHFVQWYAAEKGGAVDPSFAGFSNELVIYKPGMMPRAKVQSFDQSPGQFRWKEYGGSGYRYFVVRARPDMARKLFAEAECPVVLRDHEGLWWLYERATPCSPLAGTNSFLTSDVPR